jgi:hypothetical protein
VSPVELLRAELGGDGLRVTGADLTRSKPPSWAWHHRIVLGYLNLLIGNEGVGKGTLIAWLIAKLTRGELPGDLRDQPVGVGIIGDEDSFDGVWTPRLHAAGADLKRVAAIDRPDGGFVNVREDRDRLMAACREHGLRVLFFDQLLDNLGVGTDDWRQKAVRDALQPIRSLARELDIATLGCLHPNKRADTFRELVAGAPAFNAVSRSSLLLAEHPDDPATRVLVRGKGNLSQKPKPVEFQLTEHRFTANGHTFRVPLATGFQDSDLDVDELIGSDTKRAEHSKINDACEIIETMLPHDGDWHPSRAIYDACEGDQIDEQTVKRAKRRLGIEHTRDRAFQASTRWRWPTGDALRSHENAVPTVPTVPSANGRNPLRGSSEDTQDTQDAENKRPQCVPSSDLASDWTDEQLQALIDQGRAT